MVDLQYLNREISNLKGNDNDENNRNEEEFFYKKSGIKNNEDLLKTIPLGYLKTYNNDSFNQNAIDLTKINDNKQKKAVKNEYREEKNQRKKDIKIEDSLTSELNSDKYKIK
ncbi:hypothetical protein U3516DRAFT_765720 [Neocallimastix sp. 'constans']